MSNENNAGIDLESERAKFEAWAREKGLQLTLDVNHEGYHYPLAKASWGAWQAARRASATPSSKDAGGEPLSDVQLDRIARSYFAEDYAQQHVKNAIHDAFMEAGRGAGAAAKTEQPEHETIVLEGGNLVCTTCGTTAKIAAVGFDSAAGAGSEQPVIEVAYGGKDASGPYACVIPANSVTRNQDGSYTAFIDHPATSAAGAGSEQDECGTCNGVGYFLDEAGECIGDCRDCGGKGFTVTEATTCTIPPPGWYCTRTAGHDGPCAALARAPLPAQECRICATNPVFCSEHQFSGQAVDDARDAADPCKTCDSEYCARCPYYAMSASRPDDKGEAYD